MLVDEGPLDHKLYISIMRDGDDQIPNEVLLIYLLLSRSDAYVRYGLPD
jgi:hypothetical protein